MSEIINTWTDVCMWYCKINNTIIQLCNYTTNHTVAP